MKLQNGRYTVYGNAISESQTKKTIKWQNMFARKFNYNPGEKYELCLQENAYLGPIFGIKDILRGSQGEEIKKENSITCSTIRMGYGHYRIARAGVSCARAMGFQPYWLDLLAIPGITSDVINRCNTNYSACSRLSQRSHPFNKSVWEAVKTGEPTLPILSTFLNSWIPGWPWRFLKTNVKDYKMSELFRNLFQTLPPEMPILTSHMWICMGAVAGGI